eukprot:216863-Hanusia_phi.AAC.4
MDTVTVMMYGSVPGMKPNSDCMPSRFDGLGPGVGLGLDTTHPWLPSPPEPRLASTAPSLGGWRGGRGGRVALLEGGRRVCFDWLGSGLFAQGDPPADHRQGDVELRVLPHLLLRAGEPPLCGGGARRWPDRVLAGPPAVALVDHLRSGHRGVPGDAVAEGLVGDVVDGCPRVHRGHEVDDRPDGVLVLPLEGEGVHLPHAHVVDLHEHGPLPLGVQVDEVVAELRFDVQGGPLGDRPVLVLGQPDPLFRVGALRGRLARAKGEVAGHIEPPCGEACVDL